MTIEQRNKDKKKGSFNMANEIQRRDNFFNDLMSPIFNNDFFDNNVTDKYMRTDIAETAKDYRVKVDMPGFKKDDIHVNYNDNVLSIDAHRDTFDDVSDKSGNILHSERRYGQMSRSYRLPDVDRGNIHAKYEDGVLVLNLPKLQASNNSSSHIDIE